MLLACIELKSLGRDSNEAIELAEDIIGSNGGAPWAAKFIAWNPQLT